LKRHTNFINYYIWKKILIKKWTKSKELTNEKTFLEFLKGRRKNLDRKRENRGEMAADVKPS
jgi:hypothetical protein